MIADASGLAIAFRIAPGQAHELPHAIPLLEQLPPREKTILLLRFFGNMTQSQIAQEVGISQMHVSRLLARTLAQLRDKLLIEE